MFLPKMNSLFKKLLMIGDVQKQSAYNTMML